MTWWSAYGTTDVQLVTAANGFAFRWACTLGAKAPAMRTETVEVYSDASNAAVLRHPDRRYPGVLVQGDTLNSMCVSAEAISKFLAESGSVEARDEAQLLADQLRELVEHYKSVLAQHAIQLPFGAAHGA
ncbi:DUF6959 family protein [Roseateles sp.]|uniref:DUF6959 family protein n=1 Tax=Roseateles sp. TaxID=1971397 RepID=UPI0039EBDD72